MANRLHTTAPVGTAPVGTAPVGTAPVGTAPETATAPQERLKRHEQSALLKRLSRDTRTAAAEHGPTVQDIAEVTGKSADEVQAQLSALRQEHLQASEAARLHRADFRRSAFRHSRRAAWVLGGLGCLWLCVAAPNFIARPNSSVVAPQEAAAVAAWHDRQGQQQMAAGRFHAAEAQYHMAAALEPGVAGYHSELADALCQQEKFAAALPHWQKAVQIAPGQTEYALGLAETYRRMSRFAEAAASFRMAINLDASSVSAYQGLGFSLNALNRAGDAEKVLRAARRMSPENADISYQLGFALALQERWGEAAGCFREAALLDPTRPEFRQNSALAAEAQRVGIDAMMRKYPNSVWHFSREQSPALAVK